MKKEAKQAHPDKTRSLADRIREDYWTLGDHYTDGRFDALAGLLGERNTVLVTSDYRRILGKDSAAIWKEAKAVGRRLEIKTVSIHLTEVLGVSGRGEEALDAAALVMHEFRLIKTRRGRLPAQRAARSSNQTLLGFSILLHRQPCPWG